MVWSHSGSFSWRNLRKHYSYNCLPQELAPELIKAGTRDIRNKRKKVMIFYKTKLQEVKINNRNKKLQVNKTKNREYSS